MMIPESEWKWFGSAGHLLVGRWCRFHLCTQIGRYLVSTVGEYVHPRHGQGSEMKELAWVAANWPGEEVGAGRYFETMVFEIRGTCDCGCGMPRHDGTELDAQAANTHEEARVAHMKLCRIWSCNEPVLVED